MSAGSRRVHVESAQATAAPAVDSRTDVVESFLSDAAHVPGGFAAGVAFPRTDNEVASLAGGGHIILPVGAQSSLTGGATPRGEVVLSTRALRGILVDEPPHLVHVGAGVPLTELQQTLSRIGRYYPPVPTFLGAFVGGTVATNAAGAATFKYGATRRWVEGLTLVLADGSRLRVRRGAVTARDGMFELGYPSGKTVRVPVPTYRMPDVAKLSAGYYAKPGMDLIDLFVGSEGTLGVIVSATLRTTPRPTIWLAMILCDSEPQALALTAELRDQALRARQGNGPLDVAAIEYMDSRTLDLLGTDTFSRAGIAPPAAGSCLLLAQIEGDTPDAAAQQLQLALDACQVAADPVLALPGDERGAAQLLELREAAPVAVNKLVGAAKAAQPGIEKTAGDMVVPFDRLADALALYRRELERRGLQYAIWGHLSDGNVHPNVIPRNMADVERGREALLDIARSVIAMGGAPLAEHGVGRSPLKQRLLEEMYGTAGVDEMRAVKRAFDPDWRLAPGVLFSER